ncbi:hypothetical protein [Pseudonocardia spinosispora]|uniref:hypothetical protein n=1 Tax=Pseudonocardia spinosispora TaxID=103441 RepID=UPI0003FD663E|nr:hypothetical protein [Pseudonocardia spinosispora]
MTDHSLITTARLLLHWPEVVSALREIHQPDPDGRCLGCTSQVGPAPWWPCGLALVSGAAPFPPGM